MQIDHVFTFTDYPNAAAEELLSFGLTEGSNRVHLGQGTANRKFYFENFFLEVLWVQNEAEITSPAVLPTKLWQRARHVENESSPYGLCLVNTPDTDIVFADAIAYQPAYFPAGLTIEVQPHEQNLSLPWTCRLPFKGEQKPTTEPTSHPAGLQRLTSAIFGLACYDEADKLLQQLAKQTQIQFVAAPQNNLTLLFDHHRQGKEHRIETLNLTIRY